MNEQTLNHPKDKIEQFLQRKRINKVLPYIKGRLLDIGCGDNTLLKTYIMQDLTRNGKGVDVYQWDKSVLLINDASELPFEDKTFDTVTMTATLHHIPNRTDTLKEIHRILRTNGRLIITDPEPFISKIWHKLRNHFGEHYHRGRVKEGETFGFSINKVISMLDDAGFSVTFYKKFFFNLNRIYIAKKSLQNDTTVSKN